jgi:2-keto-4-pentenoate hydratase/2-oxohepta-3-ene-1,7-dioic acid hydratase in catechol pathway
LKLVSFAIDDRESFGIVTDSGIIDAGQRLDGEFGSLRDVLACGALNLLRGMVTIAPDHALGAVRFLPVIPDAGAKFLCVGVNYMPHIREMGRDRPEFPVIFVRFADSLVGHGQALVRPAASKQYDFEGELAVVIGRRARHVSRAEALDYVAGFSCFNDGSVRDFQMRTLQWTPGKNFHHSGSFGPWLVTRDECPDPAALRLQTRLNGQIVQDESTAELCFDVPALIEHCSVWTQLEPGDVIVTGTPGGVGAGRTPPLWMKAGDTIEVEISGIGTLSNPVHDENA